MDCNSLISFVNKKIKSENKCYIEGMRLCFYIACNLLLLYVDDTNGNA
jgi:hypothetical protein